MRTDTIVQWINYAEDHWLLLGGIAVALYLVTSVGMWLIFRKAGRASWRSLIPVLRQYEFSEVGWTGVIGPFCYVVLPLLSVLNFAAIRHFVELNGGAEKPIDWILLSLSFLFAALALALHICNCTKIALTFQKGTAFALGLMIAEPIFLLILGLDQSKYSRTDHNGMGLKASQRLSNTIIYVLLVLMAIIWLIPFVLIVLQSFRVERTERVSYILPKTWGLDNYKHLFDTNFPKWYLNTFIMAVAVAILQTVIVLCMAYTLSRFRFKSRGLLMRFMMVLGLFPGMLTMLILYNVLSDFNLTEEHSVPGLILVYVASSGMGYYVSKGFFDTIPKSLDEAARVDGATRAQVLYKIILPLAKPIVIYTVLTAFMAPWADFVFASYVAHAKELGMNVAVGLNTWLDKDHIVRFYTMFCAGGVIVAVPVAILFMCLQKYYVEGVTGGAVKG